MNDVFPALAACCLLALTGFADASVGATVGFDRLTINGPEGTQVDAAFWYPSSSPPQPSDLGAQEQRLAPNGVISAINAPLIVLCHGALGTWATNADTAVALARDGFIAASITFQKSSAVDQPVRPITVEQGDQKLRSLIDFALLHWRGRVSIDRNKIGAFGFSLGAFTVLTSVGGTPDFRLVAPHCEVDPTEWSCKMRAGHHLDALNEQPPDDSWAVDTRVKAVVIAAPALGYLFGKTGLASVKVPVQLWEAGKDQVLSAQFNSEAILRDLPNTPEFHLVDNADHADFSQPCSDRVKILTPGLCQDGWSFDRNAFHARSNAAIIRFFRSKLHLPAS